MTKIACPRCMPPGDPNCPYCGGIYDVTEYFDMAGPREIQRLKAISDSYQRRAEKAEEHCLKLTQERDFARSEMIRLRAALNAIAWPSAWSGGPLSSIPNDAFRHIAADALAIGVPIANDRAPQWADIEARYRHMSERHWTCNRCGESWNCEPLKERDERGYRIPSHLCPYCKLAEAAKRLELLEKHLENHGFPREGPMRSLASGDSIPPEQTPGNKEKQNGN